VPAAPTCCSLATAAGAALTIPLALAQGEPWSPGSAVALGVYTGLGPMAAGYALWTYAMSHPSGARLAPLAYGTPLLSTLVLLASGERLATLGLIDCGLIVACGLGVVLDARRVPATRASVASTRPASTSVPDLPPSVSSPESGVAK